eukprot:CAMPEP_0168773752 /NCGR_PEP_ID=MMETSP0725-20121227/4635_1 /TAXON_ID=265536 /ORGANISM="Amphiprora sp., Strain CCMP467" /LENGTH=103 /DNA_ID=CAMNT_0008823313 /DNA_START=13 /DNA_END=324 /DNA_ORIENTATION=-
MESSAAEDAAVEPAVRLDENPLSGQTASAVLDLKGQQVAGQLSLETSSLLFAMLQETAQLMNGDGDDDEEEESVRRITVTLAESRFVVARDENHVYISQIKVA